VGTTVSAPAREGQEAPGGGSLNCLNIPTVARNVWRAVGLMHGRDESLYGRCRRASPLERACWSSEAVRCAGTYANERRKARSFTHPSPPPASTAVQFACMLTGRLRAGCWQVQAKRVAPARAVRSQVVASAAVKRTVAAAAVPASSA